MIERPLGRRRPETLDADAYLVAGYRLVGDRGFEGLTVAALCNRLGTTKGSFYHHFEDLPAFVDELAHRWQAWIVRAFTVMEAGNDPRDRIESAANFGCVLVASGGPAMRAAATTNPAVAAAILPPSRAALTFASDTFAGCAQDEDSGHVLAAVVTSMVVGLEHRLRPMPRAHYLATVGRLYAAFGIGVELFGPRGAARMRITAVPRIAAVVTGPSDFVGLPSAQALQPRCGVRNAPEALFLGAWELLSEGGPQALTTRNLAHRVGLDKSSVRHHFGSVPAFEEALAQHWALEHTDRIEGCLRESNPRRVWSCC